MKGFIRVTDFHTGKKGLINVDHIVIVSEIFVKGVAATIVDTTEGKITLKEPFNKILTRIQGAKEA